MSVHVPTPLELVPLGEAVPLEGGAFRVSAAGHARMGEALRRRAAEGELDVRAVIIASRERAENGKGK